MFDSIRRVLTSLSVPGESGSPWSSRADALEIAVCVVLLEVAYADDALSPEDRARLLEFVESRARLSETAAEELLELADQVRRQAVELWQFTHFIGENFSLEQKRDLVEMMWKIIYDDGKLEMQEDNLIHKLSSLVGLRHSELIEAKLKVLRELNNGNSAEPTPPEDENSS
ncbi:MAG: TerB family tellurite resistance protein [Acidobacteriia bacterium]|nr:TerB family tellurite resistance protein [Terriglobia bacterium]